MLSTRYCCLEYKSKEDKYSAKFMPRYNEPQKIIKTFLEKSEYILELSNSDNIFLFFHVSQLCHFQPNNFSLFPFQKLTQPEFIFLLVSYASSTYPENYIPAVMPPPNHTSPPSTAATFLATRLMAVLQPSGYSVFHGRNTPIQLSLP